eukprot:6488448-Amphidinium_carterae.2
MLLEGASHVMRPLLDGSGPNKHVEWNSTTQIYPTSQTASSRYLQDYYFLGGSSLEPNLSDRLITPFIVVSLEAQLPSIEAQVSEPRVLLSPNRYTTWADAVHDLLLIEVDAEFAQCSALTGQGVQELIACPAEVVRDVRVARVEAARQDMFSMKCKQRVHKLDMFVDAWDLYHQSSCADAFRKAGGRIPRVAPLLSTEVELSH